MSDAAATREDLPQWLCLLETGPAAGAPRAQEALLVDYPVRLGLRRQEWRHDLLREFQLLIHASQDQGEKIKVPRRLLSLADEMTRRYGRLIDEQTDELQAARAAGAERILLRHPLPPAAREMEIEFAKALEEADTYCRREALMTIPPPADIYALRRWTVEEIVRQYDGAEPRSWRSFLGDGNSDR